MTHETAYSGSKDGSAFKFSCLSERYCFVIEIVKLEPVKIEVIRGLLYLNVPDLVSKARYF